MIGSILVTGMVIGAFQLESPISSDMCSQNIHEARIIDESVVGKQDVRSVGDVNDLHYRSFIITVMNHIFSKFKEAGACPEKSDDDAMMKLVFVRLTLVTSGNDSIAPPPSLDAPQSEVTCRLDSPWIKLTIRRSPSPMVRAVFIWNERQFLLDQAVLSGARPLSTTPLMPLPRDSYEQYARDYANSVIVQTPREQDTQTSGTISERIPPDVLWLFRNSWQTTRGPFPGIARGAMTDTLERAATSYTNLVLALVDQCFAAENREQRYESILELSGVISLDGYQIYRLH